MNTDLSRLDRVWQGQGLIGRAAITMPIAMALWWFLLRSVSLWLLLIISYLPLGFLIAPAGVSPVKVNQDAHEWVFAVAVNAVGQDIRTGERRRVESVEIAVDENAVALFASGWFSYLALAFSAAGFSKTQIKSVMKGLGLQTCIGVFGLAAHVYIDAYGVVVNTPNNTTSLIWVLKYFYHIVDLVLPFAGPFVVALIVHAEWRKYFSIPAGVPGRT